MLLPRGTEITSNSSITTTTDLTSTASRSYNHGGWDYGDEVTIFNLPYYSQRQATVRFQGDVEITKTSGSQASDHQYYIWIRLYDGDNIVTVIKIKTYHPNLDSTTLEVYIDDELVSTTTLSYYLPYTVSIDISKLITLTGSGNLRLTVQTGIYASYASATISIDGAVKSGFCVSLTNTSVGGDLKV